MGSRFSTPAPSRGQPPRGSGRALAGGAGCSSRAPAAPTRCRWRAAEPPWAAATSRGSPDGAPPRGKRRLSATAMRGLHRPALHRHALRRWRSRRAAATSARCSTITRFAAGARTRRASWDPASFDAGRVARRRRPRRPRSPGSPGRDAGRGGRVQQRLRDFVRGTADAGVECWGSNGNGGLGLGLRPTAAAPRRSRSLPFRWPSAPSRSSRSAASSAARW